MNKNFKATNFGNGYKYCVFEAMRQDFPGHFHDYYLFGCLANGSRELICGNRRHTLSALDIVFIRPREIHACVSKCEMPQRWHSLRIPAALLEDRMSKEKLAAAASIYPRMGGAFLECVEKDATGAAALDFLIRLLRPAEKSMAVRPDPAMRKAMALLDASWAQNISLAGMAAFMNMDKFAFSRKFRHATGIPPVKYLRLISLCKSEAMLEKGESVAACAQNCGYYDQSHFSKTFRRHIGVPPATWRAARAKERP